MQCAILAGGLATRMQPLTLATPKALLPVGGRPFADIQLAWLREQGVTRVVYCIAHLGEQIVAHIGDGRRLGLDVRYADEGERRLGTAGALRLAADAGLLDDAFLVLYGDSYLQVDVRAVWAAFRASGRAALMTVFHNRDALERSNVRYADGRVELYRKGTADPAALGLTHVDYGLQAYQRAAIVDHVLAGEPSDLSALQEHLSEAGQLAGFEVFERFYEIGSPAGLAALEAKLSPSAGPDAATSSSPSPSPPRGSAG